MKRHLFTGILIAVSFLFSYQQASAVPAYPHAIVVSQPNGEELTIYLKGDEKINWMESEDGYSLMYNEDKFVVYAMRDTRGQMIPSSVKASNINERSEAVKSFLNDIPKKLRYSEEQKQAFLQIYQIEESAHKAQAEDNGPINPASKATVGTAKAICALVQFPDKPFTYTRSDFDMLMNQVGYSKNGQEGSVRDYYYENSYGQLTLEITVAGPYTTTYGHDYYGNEEATYGGRLAKEIAALVFAEISPNDFDNDGDGYIDTFHYIFAGQGEESTSNTNDIWSHKWTVSPVQTYGTKRLNVYSCSPELRGSSGTNMTYIGVISHELCHVFGAPDYYDANGTTGGEYLGTGSWDLMADGSWNGPTGKAGSCPAHINMYQKIQFGWVTPVDLTEPTDVVDMPNSAEYPVAYRMSTNRTNEYYVLENRQKTNYDSYVPGSGLLIYHANVLSTNISYNNVNNTHPQRMYPVNAGSGKQVPISDGSPSDYGSINSANCTFKGTRSAFTDESLPAAFSWSGGGIGKPITNITETDGLISFKFMSADDAIIRLTYSLDTNRNRVTVSWTTENVSKSIASYNVYKDDAFLINTTNLTFTQTYSADQIKYGVEIVYNDDTKSHIEEIIVNTSVGLDKIDNPASSVYPNPVQQGSDLIIDLGDAQYAALSVYDISGRLLIKKEVNNQVSRLPVDLPLGLYILKINKEDGFETLKFKVW